MAACFVFLFHPEIGHARGKGMLKIVTNPGDAKIFINGQRKGNSPEKAGQTFAVKLPEGEYTVEAVKESDGAYEKYGIKKDVFVAEDTMQTINLELKNRISETFRKKLLAKYPDGIPEPEMVTIPGGTFKMGCVSGKECEDDEKPVHTVTLSGFEMAKTELTFEQWDACVVFGGCDHYPDDRGWGRGNRPVINVSWDDAQDYIKWLNKETGKNYRLPTEAEWEYAARAGSTTQYSWGNEIGHNRANCDGCGSQWDDKQTAPVASFAPNDFGLYDMHGNVWEWVQDWYEKHYYNKSPKTNPQGPSSSGRYRVSRGGDWGSYARILRSANRYGSSPGYRLDDFGFRLLRTP